MVWDMGPSGRASSDMGMGLAPHPTDMDSQAMHSRVMVVYLYDAQSPRARVSPPNVASLTEA